MFVFGMKTDKIKETSSAGTESRRRTTVERTIAEEKKISKPCFEHMKRVKNLLSDDSPRCTSTGQYDAIQCDPIHSITSNHCWCVDRNGNEIAGTKTFRSKIDCCKFLSLSPSLVPKHIFIFVLPYPLLVTFIMNSPDLLSFFQSFF